MAEQLATWKLELRLEQALVESYLLDDW